MGNENSGTLQNLKIGAELQQELEEVFDRMDVDGNGTIQPNEVIDNFQNAPQEGSTFKQLLNRMDADKNGTIEKKEFMLFWKNAIEEGRTEMQVRKLV